MIEGSASLKDKIVIAGGFNGDTHLKTVE